MRSLLSITGGDYIILKVIKYAGEIYSELFSDFSSDWL